MAAPTERRRRRPAHRSPPARHARRRALPLVCAPASTTRVARRVAVENTRCSLRRRTPRRCAYAAVPLPRRRRPAVAELTLRDGDTLDLVLEDAELPRVAGHALDRLVEHTVHYWQAWARRSTYRGRWRDAVTRSALVLKLMTSQAPRLDRRRRHLRPARSVRRRAQLGLPRHLDARRLVHRLRAPCASAITTRRRVYRWISDRAAGCREASCRSCMPSTAAPCPRSEARPSRRLSRRAPGAHRQRRRRPAAARHLRRAARRDLPDNKYGEAISHADWHGVRRVVDHVCAQLAARRRGNLGGAQRAARASALAPDVLGRRRPRIRLAEKRSLSAPFADWIDARNAINEDIWRTFWTTTAASSCASGRRDLDGALLMMPLVRFISATDPAWLATLDAIGDELTDNGLVMRYDREDGLDGKEGSFAACAFWHVECLARAGRIEEARSTSRAARVRQSPAALRRGVRRARRAAREFSAGAHPSGAHQRRVLPRPRHRRRRQGATVARVSD